MANNTEQTITEAALKEPVQTDIFEEFSDDRGILVPMIYVEKGGIRCHVPMDTLEQKVYWQDNVGIKMTPKNENGAMVVLYEKDGEMVFIEEWYDKETGERVKRNAHVLNFKKLDLFPETGGLAN